MYVEQVILEGFKTYMNRTVISNFDPQFNAITGLNGSGKSNILDAIQFLLGSTSKEMLRLKSGLTELIYKEGFAGIEKASVTIKFRCVEKQLRPTGYENCEQLVITRQITKDKVNKFFVNGVSSNLGKLKNLFRSVQLNIENPHFLVKQGQITKIINLKPLQLLAMIEQTAGTAYYNKTKMESQKIIQKKQQKLKSINQILNASIQPQMQKLDADRRRYIAFKDKESLLNHLNQKLRIFELTMKMRHLQQKEQQLGDSGETIRIRREQTKLNADKLNQLQMQQKQISTKANNSPLIAFNKLKSLLAEKENERSQIRARIHKLNGQALSGKQQLSAKQQDLEQRKKQKQWQEKNILQFNQHKEQTQTLLQEFSRSNSQKDAGQLIQKQVSQQQGRLQSINTEIKIMTSKKDTLRNEMENQKKIMHEMQESNQNLAQSLKQIEAQISHIENMKAPATVQDPELTNNTLKQLENAKKRMLGQFYQLNFYYQDPYNGFDRSKVKGKLFMLFKTKEKIHEKALQIGAGGKLYNIVVQNQVISKQLIERQSFGKNVTIIPNNKIRFKSVSQDAINFAARVAKEMGGLARPAYELINFNQNVQNSIMFAFSNFMVCSSMQIAQKIAYNQNRQLSCKCVTYDGDIFQYGTLSGGYMNQNVMILPQYSQLQQIQQKMRKERTTFDGQRLQYENYQKNMNQFRNRQRQMENKQNRREKIKNKLMNISLNIKKRDFQKELSDIEEKIKDLMQQKLDKQQKIQELKYQMKNKKVKSVKQQREQLQKQLKSINIKMNESKKKVSYLQVQIEQLKISIKHVGVLSRDLQKQILDLQRKEREVNTNLKEFQIQFERVEEEKKKYEKQTMRNENKFRSLMTQINQLKSLQQKIDNEISTLQNNSENIKRELNEVKKFIDTLLQKYPWLDPSEEYIIDSGFNYESAKSQYKQIEGQVDKLKRTAKMNIDDHSYQKLHEQYKNLLEKRETLEKDKVTLLNNMHDLDQKRTKTLQKCFQSVKVNLSKIFNDLLPGATAHLSLIDNQDVTKGAQLSVHFNTIKKQLSELSGGQRSLLALSFILALLLYKPSPFYILDEIDSALDLSHTQNIGYMISQRFPQSQFIIISLKQGMFQNANVLYKVHFSEGESKVDRQVIKQALRRK